MGSITITDIQKSFAKTEVLRGISLDVDDGEFVVFVGPSGCGKSTLLRIIAGLEDSSSGSIAIDGQNVDHAPPADREIAMVFQSYALYPHLNARDNMSLGLRRSGLARSEVARRVEIASSMLELNELLGRRPAELSGGQRQRVAIGRAIVREPKLFLFDEPLSNLDAGLRANTRLEIARLHRQLGATMIYVTHDQSEAMTLADRIVVLNDGVIEQIGSPMTIYNHPATLFVAGFIGSPKMNLISAEKINPQWSGTVGIRPEHLTLSDSDGEWVGEVLHVENLGPDTIVYLDTEILSPLTIHLFGEHHYAAGQSLSASPDMQKLRRFDVEGRSISNQDIS